MKWRAIFLQEKCHGKGAGKALMDKAQELHGDLEVFKENSIGRKFYSRYGFKHLEEKLHDSTSQQILRLTFSADRLTGQADLKLTAITRVLVTISNDRSAVNGHLMSGNEQFFGINVQEQV